MSLLTEVLQHEQTPDIMANAAIAAGTFVTISAQLKQTARDLDFVDIVSRRKAQAGKLTALYVAL